MKNTHKIAKRKSQKHSNERNRKKKLAIWTRVSFRGLLPWLARASKRAFPTFALVVCIGGVISGGYFGYQWATHSPRFAIDTFTFSGNQRLQEPTLQKLVALPQGSNIFLTDLEMLESRLEASPWISHASVTRDFPKTLEIEISEESAAAIVDLGGLYLVNEEGILFKRVVDADDTAGLPIISGLNRNEFVSTPSESQQQIVFALQALKNFSSVDKRPAIGEVHLDSNQGITLITYEEAIAIHLGHPDLNEIEDRFDAFDSAWKALGEDERAAVRAFRIADHTPSDRVTVAFAGN